MYADPFDFVAARSWQEAVDLLREGGEDAKVIAGGQSLIPMMTLRLATPGLLVDVNGADTSRVERHGDRLVISGVTRHSDLQGSPVVGANCPMLAEAASMVGNVRVRHRGTIGGSLAHADPSAELPCAVVALGAEVRTLGPDGERGIPANDFFEFYFTSVLKPGEIVTGVEVPVSAGGSGWSFLELLRRASDFAVVAVAVVVELDGEGRCSGAKLAAAGVGERPIELGDAAGVLVGELIDERLAAEAGRRAAASVQPSASVHASAEYRRAMLGVYVRRAVLQAARRAGGKAA
ncbi:MAG TPA: carbon monoxide dehydrogenase [Actinobacteria bacterium]|jgi:CO/xanthine dehydrogenase FAD-binding subunit|nr:carbon monoxide dehydrogenase [Actinomycetota bacterium]HCP62255.1 carbon monoxide dehydrogenase [Actinomycetota bacterium]